MEESQKAGGKMACFPWLAEINCYLGTFSLPEGWEVSQLHNRKWGRTSNPGGGGFFFFFFSRKDNGRDCDSLEYQPGGGGRAGFLLSIYFLSGTLKTTVWCQIRGPGSHVCLFPRLMTDSAKSKNKLLCFKSLVPLLWSEEHRFSNTCNPHAGQAETRSLGLTSTCFFRGLGFVS